MCTIKNGLGRREKEKEGPLEYHGSVQLTTTNDIQVWNITGALRHKYASNHITIYTGHSEKITSYFLCCHSENCEGVESLHFSLMEQEILLLHISLHKSLLARGQSQIGICFASTSLGHTDLFFSSWDCCKQISKCQILKTHPGNLIKCSSSMN